MFKSPGETHVAAVVAFGYEVVWILVNALLEARLRRAEQVMDICKRRIRMVVVIHKTMLVQTGAANFVQNLAYNLKRGLPVMNPAGDFDSRLRERTEHTPLLWVWGADPIVLLIPDRHVGNERHGALNNPDVVGRGRQLPVGRNCQGQRCVLQSHSLQREPAEWRLGDPGFASAAFDDLKARRIFRMLALHGAEPIFADLAQGRGHPPWWGVAGDLGVWSVNVNRESIH